MKPSSSHFTVQQFDDIAIVSPQGDLERYTEGMLAHVFQSLLQKDRHKVILNFSAVHHIHYGLLHRFQEVTSILRQYDGDLLFAEVNPYVKNIFRVVVMELEDNIFDSLSEAVMSFSCEQQVVH